MRNNPWITFFGAWITFSEQDKKSIGNIGITKVKKIQFRSELLKDKISFVPIFTTTFWKTFYQNIKTFLELSQKF